MSDDGGPVADAADGLRTAPIWPMAGFDPGRTNKSPNVGPLNRVARRVVSLEGVGSLAIGAEGAIYFATNALFAIRPSDGAVLWSTAALGDLSSPAITSDGKILVFETNFRRLYALDGISGRQSWMADLREGSTQAMGSDPIIGADGTAYIAAASLFAIDANSGAVRWTVPLGADGGFSPVLLTSGTVCSGYPDSVGPLEAFVVCVSPMGQERWRHGGFSLGPGGVSPWLMAGPNNYLFAEAQNGQGLALDGETGKPIWVSRGPFSPAAVGGGRVYGFTSSKGLRQLSALDTGTGNVLWTGLAIAPNIMVGGDDTVYAAYGPDLSAIDGGTGAEKWRVSRNDFGDLEGRIVMGATGELYISSRNGLWVVGP